MAMGDEYPDAEIIGTDIAKIQPSAAPLNVFFEIDDAEEPGGWTGPENEFDMIHIRYMRGAFRDWEHIYKETFYHLKPGGWVEVLDFDDHQGMIDIFDANANLVVPHMLRSVDEAQMKKGMPRGTAHLVPERLTELGFVDVNITELQIPMGPWPENLEAQRTGKHFLIATLVSAEALCLRALTEQMGWTYEQVQKLCDEVCESTWRLALDPVLARGLGFTVKILTGRKPGGDEAGENGSSKTTTTSDI
jgi:hypothetical protein